VDGSPTEQEDETLVFRRGGKATRRDGLTAFIDEGSEMEGRYSFRGTVMLNGTFKGQISSEDTLIIGERAVVAADVRAGSVRVSGEVSGSVRAMERIELTRTARVYGDMEAPVVVVAEGAILDGHCRVAKPGPLVEVPPARDVAVLPLKR
jgi:cytoskeletal protein CcmA (bactofilin family)